MIVTIPNRPITSVSPKESIERKSKQSALHKQHEKSYSSHRYPYHRSGWSLHSKDHHVRRKLDGNNITFCLNAGNKGTLISKCRQSGKLFNWETYRQVNETNVWDPVISPPTDCGQIHLNLVAFSLIVFNSTVIQKKTISHTRISKIKEIDIGHVWAYMSQWFDFIWQTDTTVLNPVISPKLWVARFTSAL